MLLGAVSGMSLLADVSRRLEDRKVPFAVIGARAAARYGHLRMTLDTDLLVLDVAVLEPDFWACFLAAPEIRRGDPFDPVHGVVRWRERTADAVDLVVGKGAWLVRVLERVEKDSEIGLPIASAVDVCLLKLDAGGGQDLFDVANLLKVDPSLAAKIEAELPDLPPDAARKWERAKTFLED